MRMDQGFDLKYMEIALREAKKASKRGEVPVGAVLVKESRIIAKDHNRCIKLNDPTAHAEILVLRKAGKVLKNYRLNGAELYVTVEPCPMCAAALVHSRISRLVFGALEPKFGAVVSKVKLLQRQNGRHRIDVRRGILEDECVKVLKEFFKERRKHSRVIRSKESEVMRSK